MKKVKETSKKASIIWLSIVAVIAVGLLMFCQFYFGQPINESTTYNEGTHINGVDISGMTKAEAENAITTKVLEDKQNINITLTSDDKIWSITGDDLTIADNLSPTLDFVMAKGNTRNAVKNTTSKEDKNQPTIFENVSAENLYNGIDSKINEIVDEIEAKPTAQVISFNPNSQTMFSVNNDGCCKEVDKALLKDKINKALNGEIEPIIEIPTETIYPENDLQDFLNEITLRGKFCTDFSKSSNDRKSNIALALSNFNGMIVEPGQTVSFNKVTGERSIENGYKNAKIIIGGKYVPGVGGGVCQASTTLYNALLLSDIEILQVYHHTLPASYVPLSFDAMVSEGYADLVFKNNLDTPIFIKSFTTDKEVHVEIYGKALDEGTSIKTKSKLIKIIPHGGDDIITDKTGEYENKVLYKGEYYRLKYPVEGYESQGFVQYYKNGQLTCEKQVRSDKYLPQNGVIIEGAYTLEEGMNLPSNTVKYIPPQKVTQSTIDSAKARWKTE